MTEAAAVPVPDSVRDFEALAVGLLVDEVVTAAVLEDVAAAVFVAVPVRADVPVPVEVRVAE